MLSRGIDPAALARLAALVRRAGDAILAVRAAGRLDAEGKADASPVTRADLAADAVLCDGLAEILPGVRVVSEERPESHGATGTVLLVDPLDGTREFISGGGDFTVNVALVENGCPVLGFVLAPATGRLFHTDARGGAVEAAPDGSVRTLRAAAGPPPLRVVASLSHLDAETRAFIAALEPVAFRQAGSSLKFCLIASGEADLYPRFGPTMQWDTAAAQAVLEAAGGVVLRLPERTPLRYAAPDRRNPPFLAAVAVGTA